MVIMWDGVKMKYYVVKPLGEHGEIFNFSGQRVGYYVDYTEQSPAEALSEVIKLNDDPGEGIKIVGWKISLHEIITEEVVKCP
jgi:hypothetical protein